MSYRSFRGGVGRASGSRPRLPTENEEYHPPSVGGRSRCEATSSNSDSFETASSMSSEQSFYSCSSNAYLSLEEDGLPEPVSPNIASGSTKVYGCFSSPDDEAGINQTRDHFGDLLATMSTRMNRGMGIDGIMRRLPPGIPIWVTVVGVLEPTCILVQIAKQAEMVESLKVQLKDTCLQNMYREDIFEGAYVVVEHQNEFYRGQVEKVDNFSRNCWVRLVDIGTSIVKPLGEIYELPKSLLAVQRLMLSTTIGDIQPTDSRKLFSYLHSHLVGKRVRLEITHLDCHYFVSSLTVVGETGPLSTVLIAKGLALAAKTVDCRAEPLIRREFPKFKTPYLNIGEVFDDICITHVVSPNDFYVQKRQSDDEERREKTKISHILRDTSNATLGLYQGMYLGGTRMCIARSHPITNQDGVAFCHDIDFTVEPAQVTVFLIDYGITCKLSLGELNEYARILGDLPAKAYRVSIDAKPVTKEWSVETTDCLREIMKLSQNGTPVRITCVRQNVGTGKSYVKIQLNCCDMDWISALRGIGEIRTPVNENSVNAHALGRILMPLPTNEFLKYQRVNPSRIVDRRGVAYNISPFSFVNIPPAVLPSVRELLKIKRFKGVYLYLVMTKRCYDLYQELKKHCMKRVASGEAEMEGHVFTVGEVVLAPWNPTTYQRCVITTLESRNGVMYAHVLAFDIEQTQSFQVAKLKRPDDYVMKMEKLCHVVWLEGVNENTSVFSQDFSNSIEQYVEMATLAKIEALPNQKLVVRLTYTDSQGATVSLGKEAERAATWNWEKYFNAGFLYQQSLLKKLYETTPFTLDLQKFLNEDGHKIVKGLCKVQIRRLELTQDPNLLYIMVIPQTEWVIDDFRALRWQMDRFYDKVRYGQPLKGSPTYPNVVALREIRDIVVERKLGSPCKWHRSVFRPEAKSFECVDCFEIHEVGEYNGELFSLAQTRGLDIREICAEMLRVPTFGKRLAVNLLHTDRYVKTLINDLLKPGIDIEVRIKRPVAQHPNDNRMPTVDIPEITNRLAKVLDAMRRKEKDEQKS
ncbi:Tudor domain-containing protein 1 [Orchesella cincta]|uniref:Tudor domain-containing protein 1 n=1 Tax=Orchesella cincta TaxID=48709 RepID=A0A1D2MEN1_ORCCI|nr:Tudor domain-containing protein 1 [Orchesella cincta]